MTVPREYKRASEPFEKFLIDARDCALLQTTNQSYTVAQGVLQAFRRRVCVKDALLFADIATMTREVRGLHPDHNMSPASAIRDVARALRGNVDGAAPDRVLARLPDGAAAFWRPD